MRRALAALVAFTLVTAAASEALDQWQLHWSVWSPDVLAIAQFGPAVGALAAWLVRRDDWPRPSTRWLPALWIALAACGLYFASEALAWVMSGRTLVVPTRVAGAGLGAVVGAQLLGAVGEELGWRGVLQPLLETGMGRFGASLATGVVWGLWHLPFSYGATYGLVFVVEVTVFAVLLGYLARGALWQRALIAGLVHWLVNVADLLIIGPHVDTVPAATVGLIATTLVTVLGVAALARVGRRAPVGSRS